MIEQIKASSLVKTILGTYQVILEGVPPPATTPTPMIVCYFNVNKLFTALSCMLTNVFTNTMYIAAVVLYYC